MNGIGLTEEARLELARLRGKTAERVYTLGPKPDLAESGASKWTLGWLAILFTDEKWLLITARSADIPLTGGAVEVYFLEVDFRSELPLIPQWPGGPPYTWFPMQALERAVGGETVVETRILSRPMEPSDPEQEPTGESVAIDTGILLDFSHGRSLLVEASTDLPMSLEVSIAATTELRGKGKAHPAGKPLMR